MDFINSEVYKKIFAFHSATSNRIIARESGLLEFKEQFNWLSKDKYAKSMVAFANNKGGYIVFGIKDQPRELVGLQSNNFENTDEAKITAYLNDVFSPEIVFEKFVVEVRSKNIGVLYTHQAKYKPVVCSKNDNDLKESDIFYRYNARSERIKYPELKLLLDEIKIEERKSWMEHLEKISKIGPTNAAILDIMGGEINGRGGTLVIDKKLVSKLKFIKEGNFQEGGKPVLKLIGDVKPVSVVIGKGGKKSVSDLGVKITDDPNAPAVRLEEEEIIKKKYPLDYKTLTNGLLARYTNFKRNPQYHKLRKEFMKDKKLCRTRYLDPNNTEGSRKDFFSPAIYKKFDKHYTNKK